MYTTKCDKPKTNTKRLQLLWEIEEIRINYITRKRMTNDLIETFKITEFLIMVDKYL